MASVPVPDIGYLLSMLTMFIVLPSILVTVFHIFYEIIISKQEHGNRKNRGS